MRSGDSLGEMPPAKHAELLAAGWRDVHRLLRQLAVSDGACVTSDDALRFEVVDGPAKDTWIELDEAGHPSRIGYPQGDAEVILQFSGWRDFDGIYAPTEIEKPGAWKRRYESLLLRETIDDQLFERP